MRALHKPSQFLQFAMAKVTRGEFGQIGELIDRWDSREMEGAEILEDDILVGSFVSSD